MKSGRFATSNPQCTLTGAVALDEFSLIKAFTAPFRPPRAPWGPGDDAALRPATTRPTVVTTDALVEGVHFTRPAFSFADIGHKALAVNLSDLAAMGAQPSWALCALGLPGEVTTAQTVQLARGMAALARQHRVALIGGNVTRSPVLSVTLTVCGELARPPLVRSGAKPGDSVWVSGPLGDAAAGLQLLRASPLGRSRVPTSLTRAQRRPEPHLAFARFVAPWASACIDVSDGLLQDLRHLAAASRVGLELESAALPLNRVWHGRFSRAELLEFALRGGEDYVLAFTVSRRQTPAFERRLARSGFAAWRIGVTNEKRGTRVDGRRVSGITGHQHR